MAKRTFSILSDDQIREIDRGALELLSRAGIEVPSESVRAIFSRAGASVDGTRVFLPAELVRECLAEVPSSFRIAGRGPDSAVQIGNASTHFQPMIGRLNILDADGKRRKTTLSGVGRIAHVCDGLACYDVLHGGAVMPEIGGVPSGTAHVAGFVETLRNTAKPVKGSCRGSQVARDCLDLAAAVCDFVDPDFRLHTTCNLVSPLTLPKDMSEGVLLYVERGWPVDFASEPQMGATSPVTLAGTVTQTVAECLSGVTLAQLVNPGAPVLMGTVGAAIDMRHATIALGGIEAAMLNAAHAQMADHYGVPSRGTGSNSNSKALDFQAGFEKSMTLLLPVLAGIDLLFYPGTLEHAETVSLESLALDNDLCAAALHAQRGVRVSEEMMSIELIRQVGPSGSFFSLPQTAREFMTEHLVRGLWDRRRREDWELAGSPSPQQRAAEAVAKLLARPVTEMPAGLDDALRKVVEAIAAREGAAELLEILWGDSGRSATNG